MGKVTINHRLAQLRSKEESKISGHGATPSIGRGFARLLAPPRCCLVGFGPFPCAARHFPAWGCLSTVSSLGTLGTLVGSICMFPSCRSRIEDLPSAHHFLWRKSAAAYCSWKRQSSYYFPCLLSEQIRSGSTELLSSEKNRAGLSDPSRERCATSPRGKRAGAQAAGVSCPAAGRSDEADG